VQTTDTQVRRLMEEIPKHGGIGLAAMRAGMDRKTARKYVRLGKLRACCSTRSRMTAMRHSIALPWPSACARAKRSGCGGLTSTSKRERCASSMRFRDLGRARAGHAVAQARLPRLTVARATAKARREVKG
jgi:hypothetical protein